MSHQIILQGITASDLVDIIEERLTKRLNNLNLNHEQEPDPLKNFIEKKEARELLGVSNPTLYRWENKGKLKSYAIGGKRYYKRSDIESAITAVNK
ncbi:helix-turn-helix domain-containing protein [Formosa haliotis]|uniref:helix-turn-helix domain-containing protein n=1 Tax=Formosa haliotis TaxID=1555194 RepID=UPI0008268677|nr:helix-turn-helix domain-containing protein [Formosa haliotis]